MANNMFFVPLARIISFTVQISMKIIFENTCFFSKYCIVFNIVFLSP